MSNITILPTVYKFGNLQIRVILSDGAPWFVAADVCRALGLTNPSMAMKALDDDEQAIKSLPGISRGNDNVNVVNESGMYTLVLRCRDAVKPGTTPHRFRKWVTSEVLPSIRKTGAYAVEMAPEVPLLINHQQQTQLEHAVHDLALYAGANGRNYRSVCLATWRDLRQYFGLKEYAQLPAARFQEAIDFVLDKRAEWEVDCDAPGYTLEHMEAWLHDMYLGGEKLDRVKLELARQLFMRAREGIREAKMHLGALNISDPTVRASVRHAKKMLSRRALTVPIEPWYQNLQLRRVA